MRNDNIIPRLSKGAGDGVTSMCAMQVVSWQNGDTKITDFPECSARPLARMVQWLNDTLAGADGFLSPEDSVIVLDLGWLTVGTAGTPQTVVWRWLADLLVDPVRGVVKFAQPDGVVAIRRVAELCVRASEGDSPSRAEWMEARNAAYDAAAYDAAAYAATAAAYAAYDAAAYDAAAAVYAAAYAAAAAAYAAAADARGVAITAAAYDAAAYAAAARIEFTRWAITHWRELAGLDTPDRIDETAINAALERIG